MHPASAQFEVLRPFINDRIIALVRARLLDGERFFDSSHALRPEYNRSEVKLALLLIRIANPDEPLSEDEKSLLITLPRSAKPKGRKARI